MVLAILPARISLYTWVGTSNQVYTGVLHFNGTGVPLPQSIKRCKMSVAER